MNGTDNCDLCAQNKYIYIFFQASENMFFGCAIFCSFSVSPSGVFDLEVFLKPSSFSHPEFDTFAQKEFGNERQSLWDDAGSADRSWQDAGRLHSGTVS